MSDKVSDNSKAYSDAYAAYRTTRRDSWWNWILGFEKELKDLRDDGRWDAEGEKRLSAVKQQYWESEHGGGNIYILPEHLWPRI